MKHFESTLLGEEIKTVLCNMAVDGSLPSDLTQLDMDSIMETATKELYKNDMSKTAIRIEKLGDYLVSSDDDDLVMQYNIIKTLDSNSDTDMLDWIDGLQVLELYESSLTVAELWSLITQHEK